MLVGFVQKVAVVPKFVKEVEVVVVIVSASASAIQTWIVYDHVQI